MSISKQTEVYKGKKNQDLFVAQLRDLTGKKINQDNTLKYMLGVISTNIKILELDYGCFALCKIILHQSGVLSKGNEVSTVVGSNDWGLH